MRPWAAARPLAVRAASCARRVGSKPGQAPPPPTGTAAWPLKPLRRPPHQWGLVCWCVAWRVVSLPGQTLPPPTGTAARPRVLQLARALRSLRRPPLRWCCVAGVWLGASSRSPARPRRSLGASWGSRVLSFWGARVRVVTNVVTPRCFLCGFLPRCYERRQSEGFFANNGGFWAWIDDVCNRSARKAIEIAVV